MSALSDALELLLADRILRNTGTVGAATLYISLWTAITDDTGLTGTEVPVANNYARHAYTSADGSDGWTTAAAAGVTTGKNTNTIQFSIATGSWGTIRGFGIHTASSGTGNLYFHGSLSADVTINNNDTFEFAALNLVVEFK